jgi:hypothetical protein
MVAKHVRRNNKQEKKAFKCIFVLLLALTLTFRDVRGQTVTDDDDDDPLGNVYLVGFEQTCVIPIQEYLVCYSTKDVTESDCFDEYVAVLACSNNCASFYEAVIWDFLLDQDCTNNMFQWIKCSQSHCAGVYLDPYVQCVEEQGAMNQCSSCPYLASGELLTLTAPTCSVFEQDYCTWQTCCEPCQFYLNFYGECMQVNFGTCEGYFEENPDLPTCPLQIQNALPPPPPEDEEKDSSENDGSSSNTTTTDTNDSSPTNSSSLDYSRMSWLSCVVLMLSCLELSW